MARYAELFNLPVGHLGIEHAAGKSAQSQHNQNQQHPKPGSKNHDTAVCFTTSRDQRMRFSFTHVFAVVNKRNRSSSEGSVVYEHRPRVMAVTLGAIESVTKITLEMA